VRQCNRYSAGEGDTVAVVIELENAGRLPIVWVLVEDTLPRRAFLYRPPSLQVKGQRIQLCWLRGRGRQTIFYQCSATAADITRSAR